MLALAVLWVYSMGMTTQRMTHGIAFTECPECGMAIGTHGLARHREQAHNVAPSTKGSKPKALTTGAASVLRKAIELGTITAADHPVADIAAPGLIRAGFLTDNGDGSFTVTEAGRARLTK